MSQANGLMRVLRCGLLSLPATAAISCSPHAASVTERPLSPPAIGRLAEVRYRVLVITGDRDLPDLRRLADTIAQTIPGASKVVISGAGHMVNVAAPEAFNRAVESFLRASIAR